MKRLLINLLLVILFTLSIILSCISITVLNDDYIKLIFSKNNIYKDIVDNIEHDYKKVNKIKDFDSEQVKKDIDIYITNRYSESSEDYKDNEIYYKHIYFINNKDIKKYSYIIYGITIILIIITGNIFLHSKKYHNLDMIFLLSSLLIILITGYIYIFIDLNNSIYNIVLNVTNHVLLGVGIFIFELVFLKYANIFIHKRKDKSNS